MTRILLAFVAGCVATAVVTDFVVIPEVRRSYHAVGFTDGVISARWEIARKIAPVLGDDLVSGEPERPFFQVKSTSVVAVERSGIPTLRVVE